MNKRLLALLLMAVLVMSLALSACGNKEEAPAEEPQEEEEEVTEDEPGFPGAAYGYAGDDPIELAVYKYCAEELSKGYAEAEIHIPTVNIINEDMTNEEDILVYGDFWIDNYNVEGDTLKTVSGGNHPGLMHLKKDGEEYTVVSMDQTEDGAGFDESAKKIFGDHYEELINVMGDDKAREELRKVTVSDYVNMNGLDEVKYYQDEGWDPVELIKQ